MRSSDWVPCRFSELTRQCGWHVRISHQQDLFQPAAVICISSNHNRTRSTGQPSRRNTALSHTTDYMKRRYGNSLRGRLGTFAMMPAKRWEYSMVTGRWP